MEIEPRVAVLETEVASLKSDMRQNLATTGDLLTVKLELKSDIASARELVRTELHQSFYALTRRLFGFTILAMSGVYFIARNVA